MNHTPAPWHWVNGLLQPVTQSTDIHTIIDDEGCTVERDGDMAANNAEIAGNRALIATAAEMRAAIELAVKSAMPAHRADPSLGTVIDSAALIALTAVLDKAERLAVELLPK